MTITFEWKKNEISDLLASCEKEGLLPFIILYIQKDDHILDSGCGLARWVQNLKNLGYNCQGLEYSEKTVKDIKEVWPELDIIVGDILCHPIKDNSFNAVLSLGVVEHFEEGPTQALSDIFRILKPGGIGIITVPCFNIIRQLKHPFTHNKLIFYTRERKTFLKKKNLSIDFRQNIFLQLLNQTVLRLLSKNRLL